MRQLSRLESMVMLIGGLLMVVGSGACVLLLPWAPYVFAPGALMFVAMQLLQRYEGSNFVIRRLRRVVVLSDVLFLLSAVLMIAGQANILPISQLSYIKYVHNNWVVVLLMAAVLQLYTSHRITHEIEKEEKKR